MASLDTGYRKFLAVDHGDKRIGVAVSDETLSFARALCIIEHVSRLKDAETVIALALKEQCTDILVGVPYDSDGGEGPRARKVLRFVNTLKELTTMPVHVWDESGSSIALQNLSITMGQTAKKRQKPSDDRVAALILQDFLDHHNFDEAQNA